jgi:hypothetical protein
MTAQPLSNNPSSANDMQFDTRFEHKQAAVETVTFLQEKQGEWKAAGYYIK